MHYYPSLPIPHEHKSLFREEGLENLSLDFFKYNKIWIFQRQFPSFNSHFVFS